MSPSNSPSTRTLTLKLIRLSEENFEMLEENQVAVTSMISSRYLATFEDKCVYWQKSLAGIAEVITVIARFRDSGLSLRTSSSALRK